MDPYLTGLIQRAQGGDVASFAKLLDLHYDTIFDSRRRSRAGCTSW
jgi:hypothetical protein